MENNPGYAQAYFYLGDIALKQGDRLGAEPLLNKAVQLQDDLRGAYVDLGIIYAEDRRNTEALGAFKRAVQLDPTEPDAHYRLARLYTVLGQKENAKLEFDKTKELHSKVEDSLIEKVSGDPNLSPK